MRISPQQKLSAEGMKVLEYLERAVGLEKLAATEPSDVFRAELLKQASAYRELATKRAEKFGLPAPSPPEIPR
jgi:hypothetical protein